MSASHINTLLDLWVASLIEVGKPPLFSDYKQMYQTIDNSELGDVKWQSFAVNDSYDIWFQDPCKVIYNMLANPNFTDDMDYQPFCEYDTKTLTCHWQDFMSGDWAWHQADMIAQDLDCLGSTFIPIVLGSDKTTVLVATGQNNYYPLYLSIGNIHNSICCAHHNAIVLIGLPAMPKTTREHAGKASFWNFQQQLFHTSLGQILKTFKPAMLKPEVTAFRDGHYQHVIYGCLAFCNNLDDDNALHCCCDHTKTLIEHFPLDKLWDKYGIVRELVPFMNNFPCADIYELIVPDLLHQIIKGTFKDHLVEWVEKYLCHVHRDAHASEILDDIDQWIVVVPSFPGLQHFSQGHHFKQWIGDDSKALMKVYLPAIEGHLPQEVISTFHAFLEFCYTVEWNVLMEKDLDYLDEVLTHVHHHHKIFKTAGVVTTFSLPCQHSMKHYKQLIQLFGTPNGLCSLITESKHVKAIKKPYQHTSKYHALSQMLIINQWLDKLAASHTDFKSQGMLEGTCLSAVVEMFNNPQQKPSASIDDGQGDCEDVDGPRIEAHIQLAQTQHKARTMTVLVDKLNIPNLPKLVQEFLCGQLYPNVHDSTNISHLECPGYYGKISIYNLASSTFYAPSDLSGYDCVFIITDPDLEGMHGMDIAHVLCFFLFKFQGKQYLCAVVQWFDHIGDMPDETTGMWMVCPSFICSQQPNFAIIHVDTIFHAAHLIPIFSQELVPLEIKPYHCYDIFHGFYVNKFADHHAFEVAF
ncbi:hypothetical protein J3A83DRAFT_4359936 [Scleroderma citrinum]